MPRLRDVPLAIRKAGILSLLGTIWTNIGKHDVLVWSSSLAYAWLLALFPFLIFLITLLPYVPHDQKMQALDGIDSFLAQLPTESAETIKQQVDAVLLEQQGTLMSLGLLLALWTASGGMSSTMSALDRCYDVECGRSFYWHRILAMGLTVIVATLMLLVVALLPIGGFILQWVWDNSQRLIGYQLNPKLKILLDIARWLLSVVLLTLVMNTVYHFGCSIRRRYRLFTPGAIFCILSWVALGLAFRLYIDRIAIKGYYKTYGALGGVVILMFLFYLAATLLLVGAEINSAIDYTVLPAPRGTKDLREMERNQLRREGKPVEDEDED